ncbi:hypothetical protein [Aquitalea sp. ASV15]|uniref:hypothetical protein n=1 Tax=Aquitalea sp. ASV15 TaxID=2795104 RepID=UPI0018EB18A7|nr:hypothetical protein [Aquitalea sp. ASV15]
MFSMFNNSDVTLAGLDQQAFGNASNFVAAVWPNASPTREMLVGHTAMRVAIEAIDGSQREIIELRVSEDQIIRGAEPVMLAGNWVDQNSISWDAVPCRVFVTVTAAMLQAAMGYPHWVGAGMYQSNLQIDWPAQSIDISAYDSPDPVFLMLSPDSIFPGDRFRVTLVRNGGNPVQIGGTAGRWKKADGSAVNWPTMGTGGLVTWHFDAFLDRMNCVAYIVNEVRIAAG